MENQDIKVVYQNPVTPTDWNNNTFKVLILADGRGADGKTINGSNSYIVNNVKIQKVTIAKFVSLNYIDDGVYILYI